MHLVFDVGRLQCLKVGPVSADLLLYQRKQVQQQLQQNTVLAI